MNLRGYGACVRREVRRGQRSTLAFVAIGLVSLLLVLVTPEQVALIPGVVSMLAGVLAVSGPLGDLASDKLHGYLEFDRTLPLSPRIVAAGRLTGAAIRVLPIALCAIPMFVGLRRAEGPGSLSDVLTFVVLPLALLVIAWLLLWLLLALNARWSFRRLWWLPMTIWLMPQLLPAVLPAAVNAAIASWFRATWSVVVMTVERPDATAPLIAVMGGLVLLVFLGATWVFASGLVRFRHDPTALGTMLANAPKRELIALGKGAVAAVAQLRLRLAAEQFRRELIVLAALFAVAAIGPGETREFARRYLPILAALLPGGIALQLVVSRANGQLEGIQQLPHPRLAIGLGHLVAIAVMALPGSVVLLITHALAGQAPTLRATVGMWAWFVAMAWTAAVVGLWLRARYLIVLLGGGTLLMVAWLGLAGGDAVVAALAGGMSQFANLRSTLGALLPVVVAIVIAASGLPVFAFALSRYEHRPT